MLCLVAQSSPTLCDTMDCSPPGFSVPEDSPCKNTRVGCHALLQGIFPTQGWNPGLLHCRWILYQLSHKGSARILEWVAYPFSSGSSWPRNRTGVSCIADGLFTNWAIREVWITREVLIYLFIFFKVQKEYFIHQMPIKVAESKIWNQIENTWMLTIIFKLEIVWMLWIQTYFITSDHK